jgi:hypothetical protein
MNDILSMNLLMIIVVFLLNDYYLTNFSFPIQLEDKLITNLLMLSDLYTNSMSKYSIKSNSFERIFQLTFIKSNSMSRISSSQ